MFSSTNLEKWPLYRSEKFDLDSTVIKNLKLDHYMKNNHFGSLLIRLLTLKQSASFRKLANLVKNRVLKINRMVT